MFQPFEHIIIIIVIIIIIIIIIIKAKAVCGYYSTAALRHTVLLPE